MGQSGSMKKNVIWNTCGSIFYSVCQWLLTSIIIRTASYEAGGILSLAMTASSSFSAISLFSMRNYQVSDIKGEYSVNEYVGSRVITCAAAFVCCAAAAVYNSSVEQMLCIDAFMLVRVAEAWVDVMHGVDQKYERYDYIGKSYILRGMITLIIFCAGLFFTGNLTLTLCVMALGNLAAAVCYDTRMTGALEQITPVFQKRVLQLLKTCIPIVVFTFLLSLENLIPKKILEQQYGQADLGIYSAMANLAVVVQVFSSVVFNPFLPRFTQLYYSGDLDGFRKALHKLYLILAGMCAVVNAGVFIFGKLGLKILYGEDILQYYDLFLPIIWCTIFTALIWIISAILIALRKIRLLVAGMIVDFALCLLLAEPLIERYNKNGVSIVQIAVMGIYILFMIVVCEISINKSNIKRQVAKDEKINNNTGV
ncbi:MAG: lipopolysaccharide biosynthesis protein [Lachnospiraceae bacterium]|nr:lipopolysaccharide biosynthesis protein [Lachnospiraceae bacterium]